MAQNLSPSGPTPYGPGQVAAELANDNPQEFLRWLRMKQDTNADYKGKKYARKRPFDSGIPGRSV